MKIKVRTTPYQVPVEWPKDWAVPPVDAWVSIADELYRVRDVTWYPTGDPHSLHPTEPHIYLVLAQMP